MPGGRLLAGGVVERIGEAASRCRHQDAAGERTLETPVRDHQQGLAMMMDLLTGGVQPALETRGVIAAVGHRVVHGGERFAGSVLIDDEVMQAAIQQSIARQAAVREAQSRETQRPVAIVTAAKPKPAGEGAKPAKKTKTPVWRRAPVPLDRPLE